PAGRRKGGGHLSGRPRGPRARHDRGWLAARTRRRDDTAPPRGPGGRRVNGFGTNENSDRERTGVGGRRLARLGFVPEPVPAQSPGRFPDGAHFRVEIPSVEGPAVLAAVLEEADARGVTVNRVSQGSGEMRLGVD